MSFYLKQGELAGAMRTYLRCHEALAKELAATVSSEIERLQQKHRARLPNGESRGLPGWRLL